MPSIPSIKDGTLYKKPCTALIGNITTPKMVRINSPPNNADFILFCEHVRPYGTKERPGAWVYFEFTILDYNSLTISLGHTNEDPYYEIYFDCVSGYITVHKIEGPQLQNFEFSDGQLCSEEIVYNIKKTINSRNLTEISISYEKEDHEKTKLFSVRDKGML